METGSVKASGWRLRRGWGQRGEGIYAVPPSLGPVTAGGGGRAPPLALGDRYRPELRRQNLLSWPCLRYWHQQLKASLDLHLPLRLRHILPGVVPPPPTIEPQIDHRC